MRNLNMESSSNLIPDHSLQQPGNEGVNLQSKHYGHEHHAVLTQTCKIAANSFISSPDIMRPTTEAYSEYIKKNLSNILIPQRLTH